MSLRRLDGTSQHARARGGNVVIVVAVAAGGPSRGILDVRDRCPWSRKLIVIRGVDLIHKENMSVVTFVFFLAAICYRVKR